MALSDRIVVIDKGRISQSGSPRDLYDRPETRFAASFVGASNRRETIIASRDGQMAIVWGETHLAVSERGPGHSHPAGTAVVAVWRPEMAQVLPNTEPASETNVLVGRIELITFQGPLSPFDVRVTGDPEVVIVDLGSAVAASFKVGQDVVLHVPPEAIRLYR